MAKVRVQIFRTALQVTRERIAALNDGELTELMRRLLPAQAYMCGSPVNQILVNTEGDAKDDGCDAWTGQPTLKDSWLGLSDTCWQLKAGKNGEPSRVRDEVTKRIPMETLTSGGRFILIASGSKNGKKGQDDRRKALVADAKSAKIPTDEIDVIGSERLADWCNLHPAVASYWASGLEGLWTLDHWASSPQHQVPWQVAAPIQSELTLQRANLDFATGSVIHLHIEGPPGVGKTRFALELCKEATWRNTVVYIRQASDVRLYELIDSAVIESGVHLTVVVDEVQGDQLRPLRESIGRGAGRIHLITIGHTKTPDPTEIPALRIRPLDNQSMGGVIRGWYGSMPPEHVDFIVRFAAGYVRLAKLAANAVIVSPTLDTHALLSRGEISGFLGRMLGNESRSALYVVAVLTSIGWTNDKENEGRIVAEHFGMEWNKVREIIEWFDREFGIVPRSGRYRYISPTPLGVHLAVEAWQTYPDLLKALPERLPSEAAVDAYYERLSAIASNPQAREFARDELRFFFQVDELKNHRRVRIWTALAAADPLLASSVVWQALSQTTKEFRYNINDRARRELVWTLERLAWKSSCFSDAVRSLALLAEAENETWANNSTGEFIGKFQVYLGGTAAPFHQRLAVLDELVISRSPILLSLVIKALAKAGDKNVHRTVTPPISDELPEREWAPASEGEYFESVVACLERLTRIASMQIPETESELLQAVLSTSMMLRSRELFPRVSQLINAVRLSFPGTREALRRAVAELALNERRHWQDLSEEELTQIESLRDSLEDNSLHARLLQQVGTPLWDREGLLDLTYLARELVNDPATLDEEWPWITSGEAADAFRLGEALAAADANETLAHSFSRVASAGRDNRAVCGYVSAKTKQLGNEWFDAWFESEYAENPRPIAVLFEVAWRCNATALSLRLIVKMLCSDNVDPRIAGQLVYSRWDLSLEIEEAKPVVHALIKTGHHDTAVVILGQRIKEKPDEVAGWDDLSLELATNSDLIRSSGMANYNWKLIAEEVALAHSSEVAKAILNEQGRETTPHWFLEHDRYALGVIDVCLKVDSNCVWEALQNRLESPDAYRAAIGFPKDVIGRVDADKVLQWIAGMPDERAPLVARLTRLDFSNDQTIASKIVGEYGENERVRSTFFGEYISGIWSGSSASHWAELAKYLEDTANRTKFPKLRAWATENAASLRRMEDRDRLEEEEEELRGRQ